MSSSSGAAQEPLHRHPVQLSHFQLLSPDQVLAILLSLRNSSSPADEIPTKVFKTLAPAFIQDLTALVNHSLAAGIFPTQAKFGVVLPLLKKSSLPASDPSSYRPITLLPLLARLLEKIVVIQLQRHLEEGSYLHDRQSGFRPQRGTELASLDILQHLLRIRDQNHAAALILLDLSAAFDTIDHDILLERLGSLAGLSGPVLGWFQSFLRERAQQVRIGQDVAPTTSCNWGVPQGSALSPVLFNVYMVPLAHVIQRFGLCFQSYADDTQLVLDLHPSAPDAAVLPDALLAIQAWMESNWLCLNEGKTEILLCGLEAQALSQVLQWPGSFGPCPVPVEQAKSLGVLFNSRLNCVSHANAMIKAGHFQLSRLRNVLSWLSEANRKILCEALVLSRLAYCNLFYTAAPKSTLLKLQALQNRTLRAVRPSIGWREHLSPHRKQLHWLTIPQQIASKTATLAWSIAHRKGPEYMQTWVAPHAVAARSGLRSATSLNFPVPFHRRVKLGGGSLQVRLPRIWNCLPANLQQAPSKAAFKKLYRSII